ncbi:hypothetical protein IAI18_01230 [Acetobacteraceae bacterium H6797]|nr:hypothetical protein [Acetobacteraceae bacterium H6797]
MTRRRPLLQALALLPAFAAGRAGAVTLPDRAELLTPGPDDGEAVVWANRAVAGLARGLPQAVATRLSVIGGPDGLTAANRFATIDGADGRSLLVLPGPAAHARLVGDARVRYEPGEWVPVCCHWQPATLVGRGTLRGGRNGPLRVAITSPEASDAVALLALDMLAIEAVPVSNLGGMKREQAFTQGAVDAFITSDVPRARVLGAEPWLDLAVPGLPREQSSGLPRLEELAGRPNPSAIEAAQAAFAAERLRFGLVLQRLTPGDVVAAWRHAGMRWSEEVARDALRDGLVIGVESSDAYGALCPPSHVAQLYREWQLKRFGPPVPPPTAQAPARPPAR